MKPKTDGHSQNDSPHTHFIILFISVFSPPKRSSTKAQLMAGVVNYLLTLQSHCGLFHTAAEAPPTVWGFNVHAPHTLPSNPGKNIFVDMFLEQLVAHGRPSYRPLPLAHRTSSHQAVAGQIWEERCCYAVWVSFALRSSRRGHVLQLDKAKQHIQHGSHCLYCKS